MTDYSCTFRAHTNHFPLAIDIDKKYFESHAKPFYLAMCEIAEIQAMQQRAYEIASSLLSKSQIMIQSTEGNSLAKMMIESTSLIESTYKKHNFGYIFEKHLFGKK